jgi:hypothetical protein
MYYSIGAGNLYRVTSAATVWPNPVQGHGAYYISTQGNRYNRTDQLSVYCSEDPLVALTEGAYYQSMKWQNDIAYSRLKSITYPLRSEHLLWGFRVDPLPAVLDLEHTAAVVLFGFSPHMLLNPSREYTGTQGIADEVRGYAPPGGSSDPRPEGLKAPSVRTPRAGAFQPHQCCLFVRNMPGCLPYDQRSQLVAKMKLEFEFFAVSPVAGSVNFHSTVINWSRPKFRIAALPGEPRLSPIPGFDGRPNAKAIRLNRWYNLSIIY